MFLIIVDYKKPLEEVERYLAEHWAFLDRYFAQGKLLCTGPQNPRTGGVIVSKAAKTAVESVVNRFDPPLRNVLEERRSFDSSPVSDRGCFVYFFAAFRLKFLVSLSGSDASGPGCSIIPVRSAAFRRESASTVR